MSKSLEKLLYDAIKKNDNPQTIQELIDQGVDCNLSYFDHDTLDFISPIQLAINNNRHRTLCLLYEHRNSPTRTQLEKHLTFYVNHHVQSQNEQNETLFDYTVSRLLYNRITEHPKIDFHTLIVALHGYDNAKLGDESLCEGSTLLILLQLRIYTLFRRIIDMTINSDDNMSEVIEDELLHNLKTYYFLDSIFHIPVEITQQMMNKKFTEITSQSSLIEYYQCIAKNVIKKIKELEINKEYTIPTGWFAHAVCVSFRRINDTHIHIRVDNPSPHKPPHMHEIVHSTTGQNRIKPKVLGQLRIDDLEDNLDYFTLLIDSVRRDLTLEEGISLIYNLKRQISKLDETQIEDVPSFDVQALTNCFVKCYEPGFSIRLGTTHHELYKQLLVCEKNNANELVDRCKQVLLREENGTNLHEESKEEYRRHPNNLDDRFILLAEDDISSLPVPERKRLQYQLRESYKQHYQYLLGNKNRESCPILIEKYVPLRFKDYDTSIEHEDFFVKPRVLLLADAGCGKTTICQYATYRWACEEIWKNKFEWVFYIKMRNLNSELYPRPLNNYSLVDIIEKECFQGYQLNDLDKQKLRNQFENPSNILWILDGCDERTIPDYLHSIERELLDKPHLLLTSRPYVTDQLKYDTRVRLQDFNDKDIENYIEKYFSIVSPEIISKCCSFIGDIGQLREAARIPACLEIICSLWESGQEGIFEQGMTTAEIYEKMCEYLLRRYLLKFHGQNTSALGRKGLYAHPNAIAFTCLEYLAFEMTKLHQLMISGDELDDIADSLLLSVIQIGLLIPKTQKPSNLLVENIYYFVHRSFQEYLCARYMIRALSSVYSIEQEKEVIQFITDEKYNRNLQNTFRLFFELKRSTSCTDQFWSAVDREPRDLVGLRHCSRIIRWFPNGTCGFSHEDREKINKRTIDAALIWILNNERRPHDFSNTYLFQWFSRETDHQYWLTAWKEDLLENDSSKRRYFLPDLWSTQNITALERIYDSIPEDKVQALHRLITKGPMKVNLKRLNIDPELFTLLTVDDETETLEVVKAAQKIATERELITTLEEFELLLQNYASFASLNRRTEALDKVTWRLKIAPSALINIHNETLGLLLRLSQQNALFDRDFELPVISFLELYAKKNDLDDDILCSLIVSITLSSKCILTAPPGKRKLIRVRKVDETFVNIELNEQRWHSLIHAFNSARDDYGFSCFFENND
jgi:hypothetical protein